MADRRYQNDGEASPRHFTIPPALLLSRPYLGHEYAKAQLDFLQHVLEWELGIPQKESDNG